MNTPRPAPPPRKLSVKEFEKRVAERLHACGEAGTLLNWIFAWNDLFVELVAQSKTSPSACNQ